MAVINKPNDLSTVWSSSGDLVKPTPTKIATGWEVEVPPRQWFNWLDNRQDQAIAHINQHGIPVWDALTEYQADKSLVMGSDGDIYKCKLTNASNDPVTDTTNTYWKKAFIANPADGSQVIGDSGYTDLGNGLVMQWGPALAGANNTAGPVVTFIKPYTQKVFSLTAMHGPTSTGAVALSATDVTLNSFALRTDNATDVGCTWIAVGF